MIRERTLSGGLRVEVIAMNFRDPVAGTTGKRIDVPVSPAFGVLVQATRWLGIFAPCTAA